MAHLHDARDSPRGTYLPYPMNSRNFVQRKFRMPKVSKPGKKAAELEHENPTLNWIPTAELERPTFSNRNPGMIGDVRYEEDIVSKGVMQLKLRQIKRHESFWHLAFRLA